MEHRVTRKLLPIHNEWVDIGNPTESQNYCTLQQPVLSSSNVPITPVPHNCLNSSVTVMNSCVIDRTTIIVITRNPFGIVVAYPVKVARAQERERDIRLSNTPTRLVAVMQDETNCPPEHPSNSIREGSNCYECVLVPRSRVE